jgi:hypothetical protein
MRSIWGFLHSGVPTMPVSGWSDLPWAWAGCASNLIALGRQASLFVQQQQLTVHTA